jgi:hypothetical protein
LQLPELLRLHGEIAADFRDLAFDCIHQSVGSAPRPSRRATYDFDFRHGIPYGPILTGRRCRCMFPLERNQRFQRLVLS